jgi:hypothetical protein
VNCVRKHYNIFKLYGDTLSAKQHHYENNRFSFYT